MFAPTIWSPLGADYGAKAEREHTGTGAAARSLRPSCGACTRTTTEGFDANDACEKGADFKCSGDGNSQRVDVSADGMYLHLTSSSHGADDGATPSSSVTSFFKLTGNRIYLGAPDIYIDLSDLQNKLAVSVGPNQILTYVRQGIS